MEPALHRTGKQELYQALIAPPFRALQKVLAFIEALDLKFLARLDTVPLPDCSGQNDLSLA